MNCGEREERSLWNSDKQGTKTMSELGSNVMRSVVNQLTGSITDAGFAAIVSTYNLPAGLTLGMPQAIVKGSLQGVMVNCYDEVQKQRLSDREVMKHNMVFDVAERTYFINDNAKVYQEIIQ